MIFTYSVKLYLENFDMLHLHFPHTLLPCYHLHFMLATIIVTCIYCKIAKKFELLNLNSDLTITKNDEEIIIRNSSRVMNFQPKKLSASHTNYQSIFVWYHFRVERALGISSHNPSCYCFDQKYNVGYVINIFVNIDRV